MKRKECVLECVTDMVVWRQTAVWPNFEKPWKESKKSRQEYQINFVVSSQDPKKDHCGFTYVSSEEENHEPLTKYRRLGGSSSSLQQVVPTAVPVVSSRSCGTGEGRRGDSAETGVEAEDFCGGQVSAVVVTAGHNLEETSLHVQVNCEEQDWEMGQSHDTEGVFNQSVSCFDLICLILICGFGLAFW